ncbi:MAG: ribosome maturation factor RimM [Anaerolineales bacterium]
MTPGSHKNGEPEFVLVGIVRGPHGIQGEVLVEPKTDFPESLQKGDVLFLGEEKRPVRIRSRRDHKGILMSFEEFNSPEDWRGVRNQLLFRRAIDSPKLPEGTYYVHELIGIEVLQENGEPIGFVEDILKTGANQVYVVRETSGKEVLIPSVSEFIRDIDLGNKQMIVRLLPGMRS